MKEARRLPARLRGSELADRPEDELLDGRVRIEAGYLARFDFLYWVKPELALQLVYDRNLGLGDRGVLLGARYYLPVSGWFRPHAGLTAGALDVTRFVGSPFGGATRTRLEAGVAFGVGLDLYIGRRFSAGLNSQASLAGGQSSVDTWISVGWTFGGRDKPRP